MQKSTIGGITLSVVAGEGFEPSKAEPGDLQIWGFAEVGSSLAYFAQFSPHIGGIK
ncbi:unannotated protein [freshwater metagenome]|uniref:Unannotated protein n=1 Tax=freshwater metagenome TaxID=449393 RepID=A0A6J6U0S9_9ZZZZ